MSMSISISMSMGVLTYSKIKKRTLTSSKKRTSRPPIFGVLAFRLWSLSMGGR